MTKVGDVAFRIAVEAATRAQARILCRRCCVELTTTDAAAGECTQCGDEVEVEALRERMHRTDNAAERTALVALIAVACDHDWQEQAGEPPVDVCVSCGKVRS